MSTTSERIRAAALGPDPDEPQVYWSWLRCGGKPHTALYDFLDCDAWYESCDLDVRRMALLFVSEAVK